MAKPTAALITGATAGLGRKTAFELAARGRPVIIGGRRPAAVTALCDEIERTTPASARPFVADLADLGSVRRAVAELADVPLHAVVANAGISSMKSGRSADGLELTFAVNVLAHQRILRGLEEQLVDGARVVVVSSGVHEPGNMLARRAGVPVPRWVGARALAMPDQAEPSQRLADGRQRYSTSKLANVLQARAFQRHLHAHGRSVDVFALDPGLMIDTNLAREIPAPLRFLLRAIGWLATPWVDNMRRSKVSARHIASLVEDPRWGAQGFLYLDGDRPKPPSDDALRDELMTELWSVTNELVGCPDDATTSLRCVAS